MHNHKLPQQVMKHFDIHDPHSIYKYAPVFKAIYQEQNVVVKQTRSDPSEAQAIQIWLENLPEQQSVRALTMKISNPALIDQINWIVYPFMSGQNYSGSDQEIKSAGHLLGTMHSNPIEYDLPHYDWPDFSKDSFHEDHQALLNLMPSLPKKQQKTFPILLKWLKEHNKTRSMLRNSQLSTSACSWDYKANNLVYQRGQAVLIDPDSAGYLPCILDLALAVLLFHNELASAPARLWTEKEWNTFFGAYSEHKSLTETEKKAWPKALKWMFLEEALWLLLNDHKGWNEPVQSSFLLDLLLLSEKAYLFELPD